MADNIITIEFLPCLPTPINGFIVKYRPVGSTEPYRVWPTPFYGSPAQFTDNQDDEPTSYEGVLQSDCGIDGLGPEVPFTAVNPNVTADSDTGPVTPPCLPASLSGSLPAAVGGTVYDGVLTLSGSAPFNLSILQKPSWMTIAIINNTQVKLAGLVPLTGDAGFLLSFNITNCAPDIINYAKYIEIKPGCTRYYVKAGPGGGTVKWTDCETLTARTQSLPATAQYNVCAVNGSIQLIGSIYYYQASVPCGIDGGGLPAPTCQQHTVVAGASAVGIDWTDCDDETQSVQLPAGGTYVFCANPDSVEVTGGATDTVDTCPENAKTYLTWQTLVSSDPYNSLKGLRRVNSGGSSWNVVSIAKQKLKPGYGLIWKVPQNGLYQMIGLDDTAGGSGVAAGGWDNAVLLDAAGVQNNYNNAGAGAVGTAGSPPGSWMRVTSAGGTTTYQTSPDAVTWTTFYTGSITGEKFIMVTLYDQNVTNAVEEIYLQKL